MWWHWSLSSHKMMPKYLFSRKKIYDSQFTAALWYEMIRDDVKLAHGKRDTRWLTEPFARSVYAFLNFSLPLENPNKLWISRWTFSYIFFFFFVHSPRFAHVFAATMEHMTNEKNWNRGMNRCSRSHIRLGHCTHRPFHAYNIPLLRLRHTTWINLFICLFAGDGTRFLWCLWSN